MQPNAFLPCLILSFAAGCAALADADRALNQAIPRHPVTGAPVANMVSEADEVRTASEAHAQIDAAVRQAGHTLDPPGAHLDQMIRIIQRLSVIGTAHRPRLPWQYWLIPDSTMNAFTTGGGYVYVHDGLWGAKGLIRERDDDELAFVLAHEIAHVNLLHVSLGRTQAILSERMRKDPFFAASFTTDQEAEADRLAVLYTTLTGYDAQAGARIWDRTRQTEANYGYLNSHPVGRDRAERVRTAIAAIESYRSPGQVNPEWRQALAENPLFPRAAAPTGTEAPPGSGIAQAIILGADMKAKRDATKAEAERREEKSLVKLLAVQHGFDESGRPVIQMQFQNGSSAEVTALGVRVDYLNGQTAVAQDPNCGGPAQIPAGQTVWLACPAYAVQGATQWSVQITDVQFR
jgi:hypothetical protein